MILRSLTVKNYRVHQEKTVEFDESRTLIGGPNESGKSTLVEAMHRALFLKAKTTGELRKEMTSNRHQGNPVVELIFQKNGSEWKVTKEYKGGPQSSTRLVQDGGKSWQNDAAEEHLLGLFELVQPSKMGKTWLEGQWPHLWVWQGQSGKDPSKVAESQRNSLVSRLQSEGLGAVMQSDFDQRVRERIEGMHNAWFTEKEDRPRAGSKLYEAQKNLEIARARLENAENAMKRLEEAVKVITTSEETIANAKRTLPGFQSDLEKVMGKLQRVEELRLLLEKREREVTEAKGRYDNLLAEQQRYEDLKDKLQKAEDGLQPLREKKASLESECQNVRRILEERQVQLNEAQAKVAKARKVVDAAQMLVKFYEKQQGIAELRGRVEKVRNARQELKALQEELSSQPRIGEKDLGNLRRLEENLNLALVRQEVTAAGIQLLESEMGVEVRVDGRVLQRGEKLSLTAEAELLVGAGTRLKLTPGGGDGLDEINQAVDRARTARNAALEAMGVADLEQAATLVARLQQLRQQVEQLRGNVELLGGEELEKTLQVEELGLSAAEAEWKQKWKLLDDDQEKPPHLEMAKKWLQEGRSNLETLESSEHLAASLLQESRNSLANLEVQLQQVVANYQSQELSLSEVRGQLKVFEEKSSHGISREALLKQANAEWLSAKEAMEHTADELNALQPALLQSEETRLNRVISIQKEIQSQAEVKIAEAKGVLSSDGNVDPQAELQQARAAFAAAQEVEKQETRRGEAIKRLNALFTESQQAINQSVVEPLAKRMSAYLSCVFGPDAKLLVDLCDDQSMQFKLSRPNVGEDPFEALSGGAKEQVAAAARLAMAEILAEEEPDRCLPIVFDDAFAYADPQRVQQLQRMLDLAANRGLQVIVLTCNPADYIGLGAKEVLMEAQLG